MLIHRIGDLLHVAAYESLGNFLCYIQLIVVNQQRHPTAPIFPLSLLHSLSLHCGLVLSHRIPGICMAFYDLLFVAAFALYRFVLFPCVPKQLRRIARGFSICQIVH